MSRTNFASKAAVLTLASLFAGVSEVRADAPLMTPEPPTPIAHDVLEPGSHLDTTSEIGVLLRAPAPPTWAGDVSLAIGSAAPGAPTGSPEGALAARLGLGYGLSLQLTVAETREEFTPGVRLLWQAVGRKRTGVAPFAFALGGQFRSEGFTEIEGEIELLLLATWTLRQVEISANAIGGIEGEGENGDLEAALGVGYRLRPSLLLGAEGRVRFGFGKEAVERGEHDELLAATVQYRVSRVQATVLVGGASVTRASGAQGGATALLRIGVGF